MSLFMKVNYLAILFYKMRLEKLQLSPILALESNPRLIEYYLHKDTGQYMFVEDVALITLDTPYVNPGLRPVCIPLQPKINSIDNKKWIGQLVEFSGWGFINETCMHIINFVLFRDYSLFTFQQGQIYYNMQL